MQIWGFYFVPSTNSVLIGLSGEGQVPQHCSFVLQSLTLEAVGEIFQYFIPVIVGALVTKEMCPEMCYHACRLWRE